MSLIVERSVQIAAAPEAIWGLLSRPDTWAGWWSDCTIAKPYDAGRFGEGSKIELVLQPGWLKVTFRPYVDLFTENKTLSLTQRSALVQSTVAWYIQPRAESTRLAVRGVFQGGLFFFMRVLQRGGTAELVLKSHLRGLKRTVERMGGEAP